MEEEKALDTTGAEAYEKYILPTFMLQMAKDAVEIAVPQPGERVLDVACGTGLGARLVTSRITPGGTCDCVDFDPAMIAVARRLLDCPSDIKVSWHCASALTMPFADQSFDLVLCLQGLQFMPDFAAALGEMRRVSRSGGRLIVTVWSAIESCRGHHLVSRGLQRRNVDPSPMLKAFALGDPERLMALVGGAGYREATVRAISGRVSFQSARHFVEALAAGAVAARHALARLPDNQRAEFFDEMETEFQSYGDSGGVATPFEQLMLVARAG
jgi:ubiquinone/menaquinone biosynthesis C-methylase UbiE